MLKSFKRGAKGKFFKAGNKGDDDEVPACALACKDKLPEDKEFSCADIEAFIAPDGCAGTCDNATKAFIKPGGRAGTCDNATKA